MISRPRGTDKHVAFLVQSLNYQQVPFENEKKKKQGNLTKVGFFVHTRPGCQDAMFPNRKPMARFITFYHLILIISASYQAGKFLTVSFSWLAWLSFFFRYFLLLPWEKTLVTRKVSIPIALIGDPSDCWILSGNCVSSYW